MLYNIKSPPPFAGERAKKNSVVVLVKIVVEYVEIMKRMHDYSPLPSLALFKYQSEGVTISFATTIEA